MEFLSHYGLFLAKTITIVVAILAIIGGIIAQVGDLTLDGSLKTQLKSLTESLRRGEGV